MGPQVHHPAKGLRLRLVPDDPATSSPFTTGFLCPVEANTPGVQFLEFQVLDPRTGAVLFDVKHHAADLGRRLAEASLEERAALAANLEDLSRSVEYAFPAATLRSPTLRTK